MPSAADFLALKSNLKATTTVVRPHPCVASGVQQFGRDFLGNAEASRERYESEEQTRNAAKAAADLIRAASCVVIHTGAGIATAAGVGDFRGSNGVWTQLSKGIIPDDSFDITSCVPSFAHMATKALVEAGMVQDVISTNHDGLHMKSGLVIGENLHELHGNVYVERCVRCFKDYARSYPVLRTADRYTGRDCRCGGILWDSGVDFGQSLPQHQLHQAQTAARKADVHLVLGSSLQVAPSSLLPRQYGGKLILVTKSNTPVDSSPAGNLSVRSYGDIDTFMRTLVEALAVSVPCAPTLEESQVVSITMLVKRRWALREERVAALEAGELREINRSLSQGWSNHIDAQSEGIDYWFHSPSNQISFGRPCEEPENLRPSGFAVSSSLEARAPAAERAFAAAAPTISEARAALANKVAHAKGGAPPPPPSKGSGKAASKAAGKGKSAPPLSVPKVKGKGKTAPTFSNP